MKRTVFHVALGLVALFAAHGAQATQKVIPAADAAGTEFASAGANAWGVTVGGGQQLVFYGRYTSTNANESGLGLKIEYDATKITNVAIDQVLTKCMLFTPDVTVNGASSKVLFGWADTSQRADGAVGWPSLADGTPPCINPAPPAPPIATTTAAFPAPTTLFRFTATTAGGFTSGTSTIALSSPSASSAAGASSYTNTSLVVTGGTPPAISFVSASSRKSHGGTPFDIAIDAAGSMTAGQPITVEPRTIGAGHQIVFLFNSPPTSASVATSSGAAGGPVFAGNEAIVTLTGVADGTRVQVDLTNVNGVGVAATARIGFLVGDANGSRLVNSTDILTVKANSGVPASAPSFKSDLNASGLTNSTDILTVKASSGHPLP